MNKIGLKLWNTNTDFYLDCAAMLYKKKLFDFIELYIVPGHSDKIDNWKLTRIPFIIHAPHSANRMNLSKKEYAVHNRELYFETKEYADKLGAKYIIFHGGVDGQYEETAEQILNFNESRAVIENKPCLTLPHIEGDYYVGYDTSSIQYIIEKARCKFCLDVGHAITSANALHKNVYKFIDELCNLQPVIVHLSDIQINTTMDAHLNLGDGEIDFERLFSILGQRPYFTIETNKRSSANLDDFIADVTFLRDYLV